MIFSIVTLYCILPHVKKPPLCVVDRFSCHGFCLNEWLVLFSCQSSILRRSLVTKFFSERPPHGPLRCKPRGSFSFNCRPRGWLSTAQILQCNLLCIRQSLSDHMTWEWAIYLLSCLPCLIFSSISLDLTIPRLFHPSEFIQHGHRLSLLHDSANDSTRFPERSTWHFSTIADS